MLSSAILPSEVNAFPSGVTRISHGFDIYELRRGLLHIPDQSRPS